MKNWRRRELILSLVTTMIGMDLYSKGLYSELLQYWEYKNVR